MSDRDAYFCHNMYSSVSSHGESPSLEQGFAETTPKQLCAILLGG